jgi:hypothetical protein
VRIVYRCWSMFWILTAAAVAALLYGGVFWLATGGIF